MVVVRGAERGTTGKLLAKDNEKETALVQVSFFAHSTCVRACAFVFSARTIRGLLLEQRIPHDGATDSLSLRQNVARVVITLFHHPSSGVSLAFFPGL